MVRSVREACADVLSRVLLHLLISGIPPTRKESLRVNHGDVYHHQNSVRIEVLPLRLRLNTKTCSNSRKRCIGGF